MFRSHCTAWHTESTPWIIAKGITEWIFDWSGGCRLFGEKLLFWLGKMVLMDFLDLQSQIPIVGQKNTVPWGGHHTAWWCRDVGFRLFPFYFPWKSKSLYRLLLECWICSVCLFVFCNSLIGDTLRSFGWEVRNQVGGKRAGRGLLWPVSMAVFH